MLAANRTRKRLTRSPRPQRSPGLLARLAPIPDNVLLPRAEASEQFPNTGWEARRSAAQRFARPREMSPAPNPHSNKLPNRSSDISRRAGRTQTPPHRCTRIQSHGESTSPVQNAERTSAKSPDKGAGEPSVVRHGSQPSSAQG